MPTAVGTLAAGEDPDINARPGTLVALSCGELLALADRPAARAEMPGSCATEAVVEVDILELGLDIGSMAVGSRVGSGTRGPSSITDLIGGRDGESIRIGIGATIGGRYSACGGEASADAVIVMFGESREASRLGSDDWLESTDRSDDNLSNAIHHVRSRECNSIFSSLVLRIVGVCSVDSTRKECKMQQV